jgi:lactoylglutathione lyase
LVQKATSFGAVLVKEPTQKPWGQIVAYVRDLDGFLVEICTEMQE